MAEVVPMPKLGVDMAEGVLVRWVIAEGGQVKRGDVLAEIETDKATVEVESAFTGLVHKHLAAEEDVLPVCPLAGAFVDVREIQAVVSEDIQHLGQRTGLVLGGEHDAGLIITAGLGRVFADDEEPCRITRVVLDVLKLNFQAINFACKG